MRWSEIYKKLTIRFLKVVFLLSLNCISFERGLKSQLYFSTANIAVYKLDVSPIKFSELAKQQIKLENNLLKSILFTIRKERTFLRVADKESLWSLETIEELLPILNDLISPANKNKTFFLIVKEEDKLSPYSRIFRTNFYFTRDGNTLQFIFGEVNNNINFGTQFAFSDWANPSFFKIVCKKEKPLTFSGKLESAFHFKKDSSCADKKDLPLKTSDPNPENLNNNHWVQVDLEKVLEANKVKSLNLEKENSKSRELRLKELFDLYKKGLINKDDYEIKKAEILGEI